MENKFTEATTVAVEFQNIIKNNENKRISDFMSSRMVRCAAVLNKDGHIGWQMEVPNEGLVNISVFGTSDICTSDMFWITEKTGTVKCVPINSEINNGFEELYELYLPIAEMSTMEEHTGFGCSGMRTEEIFSKWPTHYSSQFEELIRVLRQTSAIFRVVLGPADENQKYCCRKNMFNTFSSTQIDAKEYLGKPVKISCLMRLPEAPSMRLRAVLEEAVPGMGIRHIGKITQKEVMNIWKHPLEKGIVLPEYAAQIMTMEPSIGGPIIGVEICEERMEKLPVFHRSIADKKAVVLGKAMDVTGRERTITMTDFDLRRHYQIIGQTGTGKSTLLSNIILSCIKQGKGLTFFDPHGSTIETVLKSVPSKFANKIRVVHIGDKDNPVPLNVWDSDDPYKEERNIGDLCELFAEIFDPKDQGYVGPRYERWLSTFAKASIALLGKRASLESITVLSKNKENMRKTYCAIYDKYPELAEIIMDEYIRDCGSEFSGTLNWYLCKFQRILSVEQLRKTLGAGANALDFRTNVDTDMITLIDLATPTIGTSAARIIGTIMLMKLWNAILEKNDRDKLHMVILDEAALFQCVLPRMLAEGRKFGLSMILCHQHIGQLTEEIRDALEANSANFSAFRLSPNDARNAAVRLNSPYMQYYLPRMDAFNAVTTLSVNGMQTMPFTLEIERPNKQKNAETTSQMIEQHSVETLVTPYRDVNALTPSQIQKILNEKEKEKNQKKYDKYNRPEFEELEFEDDEIEDEDENLLTEAS